ncbi:hypothetical protein pb186bvf_009101 [Paramecium bursaria]
MSRRRQKKGEVPGDFKCTVENCLKEYLSYPALYTHIKEKHGSRFLSCMQKPENKGSRGRPKREDLQTVQPIEQPVNHLHLKIQIESIQTIDDFLLELWNQDLKFILQSDSDMLKILQVKSGLEIVFKFLYDVHHMNQYEQSFLYELESVYRDETNNAVVEDNLIDITIDRAMALFIKKLSHTVNIQFLQSVAYLLFSLRSFINQLQGHNYAGNSRPITFGDTFNQFMLDHKDTYLNEELLKQFYDSIGDQNKIFLISQGKILRLTGLYFCNWLFNSRYSSQQLTEI